jgi:hypothetical protein
VSIGTELSVGEEEDLFDGRTIGQLIDKHTRHSSRTWLGDKKRRRIGVRAQGTNPIREQTMLRRHGSRHKRRVQE